MRSCEVEMRSGVCATLALTVVWQTHWHHRAEKRGGGGGGGPGRKSTEAGEVCAAVGRR